MFLLLINKSSKILRQFGKCIRSIQTTSIKNRYALEWSPNARLSKTVLDKYMSLPLPECKSIVKYVWIDGTGQNLRSKSRTLDYIPSCYKECPNWSYDGSSTFQGGSENSDTYIVPVAMYKDPFRRANNRIVLCDTYTADMKPTPTNHRYSCLEVMCKAKESEPSFGLEQEYQLMDIDGHPFGWPSIHGHPADSGKYYCGIGAENVYGRDIVEAHYRACLYAGISLCGTNAEVTLSQWEFQVGVCEGIKAADDLWMARFILIRIAEEFGVAISLHPKLFPHWTGAGCHTNFSTKSMRSDGGMTAIEEAISKLAGKHKEHLTQYDPSGGADNAARLTGRHETSSTEAFTHGVANRNASVRIPREVAEKGKGYLEDRRPASNCDPYSVTESLVKTCVLE